MGTFDFSIMMLAINGLTLTLALGLFLLVLWLHPRRQQNIYFGLYLLMVVFWTSGSLLSHVIAIVSVDAELIGLGIRLLQAGFVGSTFGVYLFTVTLTGSRGRMFAVVAIAGFLVIAVYQVILIASGATMAFTVIEQQRRLIYSFQPFSGLLFLLFGGATTLLLWFQRRRIRGTDMKFGLGLFVAAQFVGLINPYLRSLSWPILLANIAVFVISFSLMRQQVISPLLGRTDQLEAVRDVGLVITSSIRLDDVLSAIAAQATALLNADASAIFQLRDDCLVLAASYNMPHQFVGYRLESGEGAAGEVVRTGRTLRIDDYAVEWQGTPDLPLAHSTFGSVAVAPLISAESTQGILLVVQGRQGKIFSEEDVRLLELLGPQAAVAIANSELFEQQNTLTGELIAAKNQLETVLTSTQSPVVAVDRQLRIIFANVAAHSLFAAVNQDDMESEDIAASLQSHANLIDFVPRAALPQRPRQFLKDIKMRRAHIYELELIERTYLCHIAPLGNESHAFGWVAVLNDVTELKELDRFKSQMVRMTSHDLKNPLFAAMSYLELLQDELQDINAPELNETYVKTIMQQLDRMNRTVSSILDLERVQAGILTGEVCHIPALITRELEDIEYQIDGNKLLLEVNIEPELPPVSGDRRQLSQLIANIIENAVKFTPDGGGILVEARSKDKGVLIVVKDTGVGIPEELHSRVFERFYRGQQPGVEHVSGSGLGLSLVRAITTAHQGRVWLESEPGQGTTVFVWLPAAGLFS
jgi:signal transduction histidine kinase